MHTQVRDASWPVNDVPESPDRPEGPGLPCRRGVAARAAPGRVRTWATGAVLAAVNLFAQPGLGQDSGPLTSTLTDGNWLAERAEADPRPVAGTWLGDGLLDADYFSFKSRLWRERDFAFGGYYSVGLQWGSQGGPTHAVGELLVLGTWEPIRTPRSAGRLVMGFAHDGTLGHPTTREFANRQGLVETPNDLDTESDLTFHTIGLFHWEAETHTGPERGWAYRAGQIYAPSYFGISVYLDDDRSYFMGRPLAAAAGAQWVGANDIGLGGNVLGWVGPYYTSIVVMDAKANRKYPDFASLFDGKFLYLGEIGYESDVGGPEELAIRITVSHLDVDDGEAPGKGPGQSAMVSYEQRFGARMAVAARWSRSFKRLSAEYRELLSLGLMWLRPLRRTNDVMGFGVFAGDPSDGSKGTESGAEFYYRLQLTQAISVTPDLQYWSRSDASGTSDESWIYGLRLNFEY